MWLENLASYRERVLRRASLSPGETLLDVGCGDGLIGFGAATLVGESGRVIFSDISPALLDECRRSASQMHLEGRCSFVRAPADDLSPIPDGSIDVVTTRSVLIYVEKKAAAFQEFARVLTEGGRISLFEPINRHFADDPGAWWGYDVDPIHDLVEKIEATWHSADSGTPDPMMDFDEKDLFRFAEMAGFRTVRLDLEVVREPGSWVTSWEALLDTAGNPLDPTLRESMEMVLSPEEIEAFEAHVRPQVEKGEGVKKSAFAYLYAAK